jgi:hypothetical protein
LLVIKRDCTKKASINPIQNPLLFVTEPRTRDTTLKGEKLIVQEEEFMVTYHKMLGHKS